MRALALVLALAACSPAITVVNTPVQAAPDPVSLSVKHTLFASDLGCTAVDIGHGYVLTAKHCVDDLEIGALTEKGVLTYRDEKADWALLIDLERVMNDPPVFRKPVFGEHVYAVGYPVQKATKTQELTITDGIIAGPSDRDGQLRITAPIYFGNSGGGLWGNDGALLGITVSGFLDFPGMNYIVPINQIESKIPR